MDASNAAGAGGGNPFDATASRTMLSRKYTCMIKPAQSGKTRTMQELMLEYEKLARVFQSDDSGLVNIVICSKNLNLVKQTHARMTEIISPADDDDSDNGSADATIDGDIFSWMTGTKDTNISPDALAMKIALGDVRMVVCCAHSKRIQYVANLMAIFHRAPFLSRRFNIWMDEADDYVNIWSDIDLAKYNCVSSIYLVSATIDDIVEKHNHVKVMPFITTFPPCYRKMADAVVEHIDVPTRDAADYFKQVYASHKETLCVPGMRLFAPGSDVVVSHNAIAEFLQSEGFAVAVINGRRKCILVPGTEEPLSIVKEVKKGEVMEIGKVIAKMYRDHNLARFPFAITGKLCLGRGITFQCQEVREVCSVDDEGEVSMVEEMDYDFLFDAGIIPPMNKTATLYQCAARMNGNIGEFKNYKPSTIYTTSANHVAMMKSENIAKNLAVLVRNHNLADVGRDEMDWADHGDEEQYHRAVADRKARAISKEDTSKADPIVVIKITDAERDVAKGIIKTKNGRPLLDIIKTYDAATYARYAAGYTIRGWNLDTDAKCSKWGLSHMLTPNALSRVTNFDKKDRTKNVSRIYLHKNVLILTAWSGAV
jgi:hypothetical protein